MRRQMLRLEEGERREDGGQRTEGQKAGRP